MRPLILWKAIFYRGGSLDMDVKEGHPGAIFHWFFDSGQGTDNLAQLLVMLHGTSVCITNLANECLNRQDAFNDALGLEILFIFFDPNVPPRSLAEDGSRMARHHRRGREARFLFADGAFPMPPGFIEFGRGKFESIGPDNQYYPEIALQAAEAHRRAVPFFQQAFELEPCQNYLLVSHRQERTTLVFALGDEPILTSDELLKMMLSLRPIARHSKGAVDLVAIEGVVQAHINRGALGAAFRSVWGIIEIVIRSLGR